MASSEASGQAFSSAELQQSRTGETNDQQGNQVKQWSRTAGHHVGEAWTSLKTYTAQTSNHVSTTARSCFSARPSYSSVPNTDEEAPEDAAGPVSRRSKWSQKHPGAFRAIWSVVGLLVLFILVLVVMALHLFMGTLSAPSSEVQKAILDSSLLIKGPDSISVLNITDAGVNVAISGRLGLDPDRALDLWLGEKSQMSAWRRWDRSWVEWVLKDVKAVRVELGMINIAEPDWSINLPEEKLDLLGNHTKGIDESNLSLMSAEKPANLLSFRVDPILIPIPALADTSFSGKSGDQKEGTPRARKSLHSISLELLFKPATPAEEILAFAKASLSNKKVVLDLVIDGLRLNGLNQKALDESTDSAAAGSRSSGVAKWVNLQEGQVRKRFSQKIPKTELGNQTDSFLDLTGYEFFEIGSDAKQLPAAPSPAQLVTSMLSGRMSTLASRALGIKAHAVAQNPLGKILKGSVPFSLPFGVFLPVNSTDGGDENAGLMSGSHGDDTNSTKPIPADSVLMAVVAANPFDITGGKEIALELLGRVVPPPQDALPPPSDHMNGETSGQVTFGAAADVHTANNPAQVALSDFLSKFLRGEPNTVIVHGGNPFLDPNAAPQKGKDDLPGGGSILPGWLDNALRQLQLPISFPGSKVTDLIQNVSISDLAIHPHPFEKEKLLCDGTVTGVMDLPGQLATVDVMITDLWPDIIVYNGKPPGLKKPPTEDRVGATRKGKKPGEPEPAPPLPDPLPKHAFGRVRPHGFTEATTYLDPEDPNGTRKLLKCVLKNVPFEVLPGRGEDFRSFTWKLLTGSGALTGIEGSARAKIWNSGLGKLELQNLPVSGAFMVGQRGGDGGDGGGGGDDDDDGGGDDDDDDRW